MVVKEWCGGVARSSIPGSFPSDVTRYPSPPFIQSKECSIPRHASGWENKNKDMTRLGWGEKRRGRGLEARQEEI